MHYHLLTKNLLYSLICFGLLSEPGVAFAQVYKSYDADGNVVFSDKPAEGSKEVEVTSPNVSDSFEVPPPVESPPETKPELEAEPEPVTQPIANEDSADTNNDGRISRREKEEHREKRRKLAREKAKAAEEQ